MIDNVPNPHTNLPFQNIQRSSNTPVKQEHADLIKQTLEQLNILDQKIIWPSNKKIVALENETSKPPLKTESSSSTSLWTDVALQSHEIDSIWARMIKSGEFGDAPIAWNFAERDVILPSGKTMSKAEIDIIRFYTINGSILINGVLGKDDFLRSKFLSTRYSEDKIDEISKFTIQLAQALASAVNKLDPVQNKTLYRGDCVTEQELEELKQGKIIVNTQFMSSSLDPQTEFAVSYAWENNNLIKKKQGLNPQNNFVPILYCFEGVNAKDISMFAYSKGEKEHLYLPGQALQSVGWVFRQDLNMHVVYFKEINRSQ